MLNKLSKILVYSLIFLLPLVFAPLSNALGFPKQTVLVVLAALALFFCLLNAVLKGSFLVRLSIIDFSVLGLLLITGASTFLAKWPWASFWGWPQDTANSFLTVLFLAIFYFLITGLFQKDDKEILLLQAALAGSAFLTALIGILQLFGLWTPEGVPSILAGLERPFNTVGTFNAWGLFLGALIPIAVALVFKSKGITRVILGILALPIILGTILANYWIVWLTVAFSMAVFLVFTILRFGNVSSNQAGESTVMPRAAAASQLLVFVIMTLFTVFLFMGIFKVSVPGIPTKPLVISPSIKATWNVSRQMIAGDNSSTPDVFSSTSGVKGVSLGRLRNLLLGWGPGSFKYGWSMFKNPELNKTIFWNIRFGKGGSEILEILGEGGLLESLAYFSLIVLALFLGFFEIAKSKKSGGELVFALSPLASFAGISLAKFLYPGNLSLAFLWWFCLALISSGLGISKKKEKGFNFAQGSRLSLVFSFLMVLIFVGTMVLFFFQGMRILAELKYNKAQLALAGGDRGGAATLLLEAIRRNPHQETFYRDLAQVYLARAREEMTRTDISNEDKVKILGNLAASAVNSAKKATDVNPANVANWQVRGEVYRNLVGWSGGALDWSLKAYEKADSLEPANPFIMIELARTYTAQASLVGGAETASHLEKAEEYIKKAIDLKPDYAPAYFQQALIYELKGESKEAIATLEGIKNRDSFLPVLGYRPLEDVGLAFQLGVLYYREGTFAKGGSTDQQEYFEKAREEFERAINLSPNYSNARYFLGLIYDKKGERDRAIAQFEIVSALNPENEEVKRILNNLTAGKPALEGIVSTPETLLIEEEPEER